jgi:hypothetical protein
VVPSTHDVTTVERKALTDGEHRGLLRYPPAVLPRAMAVALVAL